MQLLQEVKKYPDFKHIWLDRDQLTRSLGFDIVAREYIDLTAVGVSELGDLLVKSVMWLETVNELLGNTDKLYLDQLLEVGRVYATELKNVMAIDSSLKITEGATHAKATRPYIEASKKANTLKAYSKFLERLIENINKLHYTIKSRDERMHHVERKY